MTLTIETAAERIAAGETLEAVAADTGWPIIEDGWHGRCLRQPGRWYACDDGGQEEIYECASGLQAAEEYVYSGDYDDVSKTDWVTVRVYLAGVNEDGEIVRLDTAKHKITIEPEEPECTDDEEHDWRAPHELVGGIESNPGVYASGGGVRIHEACIRCGCGRVTDTWAQDRSDGEQGLRSLEYTPGQYTEALEEALNADA